MPSPRYHKINDKAVMTPSDNIRHTGRKLEDSPEFCCEGSFDPPLLTAPVGNEAGDPVVYARK